MTTGLSGDDPGRPGASDPFDGPEWGGSGPGARAEPKTDHRPRSRASRHKRHGRRRLRVAVIVCGGALFLAGLWLLVTGLMAHRELGQVRSEVHTLRGEISTGDMAGARSTGSALAKHAHRARQLTSGPIWAVAAQVPAAGEPLRTIRGITKAVDSVGQDVLPQLVTATARLDPSKLRRSDGSVDLAALSSVAPALDHASTTMATASAVIGGLPPHTWLSTIDSARSGVLGQLAALSGTVRSADLATHILPRMLGRDGPKRYFVAFQNEAEARGTGGLPGAFAILEADHGNLRFVRFESDSALSGVSADVDFGADYRQLYDGAGTTTLYGNGNLSPNFPYAAQIWASMWHKKSGEHVDGVIAFDPTALSYLLAVTGPAALPDHSQVSARNVVSLTQSAVYRRFAVDNAGRQRYLLDVARVVGKQILNTRADPVALVRAAGTAAGERRLLAWSADPTVQSDLAKTSVSGLIPSTPATYVGLSIVNDGGNKLDYYLDRSLTWQRTGCGATRQVTVTIKLSNNAPAIGLPPYVTLRSDSRSYPVKPGDNRLEVGYFATRGATMSGVAVDGHPATASIGSERGHPVYTVDLELPRGTSRTVVLHLSEPAGPGEPTVLRQPLVRPLHVVLRDARCH